MDEGIAKQYDALIESLRRHAPSVDFERVATSKSAAKPYLFLLRLVIGPCFETRNAAKPNGGVSYCNYPFFTWGMN